MEEIHVILNVPPELIIFLTGLFKKQRLQNTYYTFPRTSLFINIIQNPIIRQIIVINLIIGKKLIILRKAG